MKAVLTVLLFLALGATAASAATDAEMVRAARARQNAAIIAGNLEAIASCWTDDVTICRGLGVQLAGSAAYRKLFAADKTSAAPIVYQREPTAVDVSAPWPLAFETGVWQGHLGSAQGPVVISGRYSAQWVKREGRWLIRAEVFVALDGAGPALEAKAAP